MIKPTNDRDRQLMVTQFVCSQCGSPLCLSLQEAPETEEAVDQAGAIPRYKKIGNTIAIYPCGKCYSAATKPIEALRDALRGL